MTHSLHIFDGRVSKSGKRDPEYVKEACKKGVLLGPVRSRWKRRASEKPSYYIHVSLYCGRGVLASSLWERCAN